MWWINKNKVSPECWPMQSTEKAFETQLKSFKEIRKFPTTKSHHTEKEKIKPLPKKQQDAPKPKKVLAFQDASNTKGANNV
jgi:hypothetical protein